MIPSTLKALAYIVQTISRNDGTASFNQLLSHRREVRRVEIGRGRDQFLKLKILETSGRDGQDYSLVGLKEGNIADFLTIWMRKKANVSPVGHRSVRVAAQIMALHEGVTSRAC